jgi:DNA-binding CsgD family transcriptional regulator
MAGRDRWFLALFAFSAGLMLLWYKRVIIAIGEDERNWFLPFCGLGFLAVAIALDSGRMRADNRTVVLASLGWTMPSTALIAVPGGAHSAGLALAGFGAGVAFSTVVITSMPALPYGWRAFGFASVFMVAGALNTTTDLAELSSLRVAGPGPNLVMGVACLAGAFALVAWRGRRFNLRIGPSAQAESGDLRWVAGIGVLAIGSFLLLYALVSLHESVAYPAAVTGIASTGFVRYVELPLFLGAAWLADRVGRQAAILGSLAAALVGTTGLAAGSGTGLTASASLCLVVATVTFPVACCALVADVMCYASRPALLGCLCFAPVVVGQMVDGFVRPRAEALSPGAFAGWSLGVAAVWTAVTLALVELIRVHFAELRAAAAVVEAVGDLAAKPDPEKAALDAGLTRREAEVFALSAKGMTVRQMATELFVTEATVKFHVTNMLRKTGATSRAELAVALLGAGESARSLPSSRS